MVLADEANWEETTEMGAFGVPVVASDEPAEQPSYAVGGGRTRGRRRHGAVS